LNKFIFLFLLTSFTLYSQIINITTEDTTSWYKTQLGTKYNNSGATCIAMIIDRWGPNISPETVQTQISSRGKNANFDELLRILSLYGIKHYYLQRLGTWDGRGIVLILVDTMDISNTGYEREKEQYMIVIGQTENSFIVNDPMAGSAIRYYNREEILVSRFRYAIWIP